MNAHNIYTRKSLGLDNRIWRTLIIVAALSAGLVGFRMATDIPCAPISIEVHGFTSGKENSYYLGQNISFTAKMKNGKDITWDFGDHSPVGSGNTVRHAFQVEGNYIITATVNGKCTESVSIMIRQLTSAPVISGTEAAKILIAGPESAFTGVPVSFSASAGGEAYEWTVLNSPGFPVQSGSMATFIFPTPGTRIIQLKLNNDPAKVDRKQIQVLQSAQETPPPGGMVPPPSMGTPMPMPQRDNSNNNAPAQKESPEAPKVLIIPDEEFKSMLEQVTLGSKDAPAFNQFLCSGVQTKALVNGKETVNFGDLCGRIHDNKKYVIKSVETIRNDKNCVMLIKVNYKKKGLLGL